MSLKVWALQARLVGLALGVGSEVFEPERDFEVWGIAGVGGAGCVALISSGTSGEESAFMDASASGGDVFFLTAAHLVSGSIETGASLYDAHECTSVSPCPAEAEVPPVCDTAEGCRAAPEPQPSIFGAPSSATFHGSASPRTCGTRLLRAAARVWPVADGGAGQGAGGSRRR